MAVPAALRGGARAGKLPEVSGCPSQRRAPPPTRGPGRLNADCRHTKFVPLRRLPGKAARRAFREPLLRIACPTGHRAPARQGQLLGSRRAPPPPGTASGSEASSRRCCPADTKPGGCRCACSSSWKACCAVYPPRHSGGSSPFLAGSWLRKKEETQGKGLHQFCTWS